MKETITKLLGAIAEAEQVFKSEAGWEFKYDRCFHLYKEEIKPLLQEAGLSFDWYDPDTTYQEDVTSFMNALLERRDEIVGAYPEAAVNLAAGLLGQLSHELSDGTKMVMEGAAAETNEVFISDLQDEFEGREMDITSIKMVDGSVFTDDHILGCKADVVVNGETRRITLGWVGWEMVAHTMYAHESAKAFQIVKKLIEAKDGE